MSSTSSFWTRRTSRRSVLAAGGAMATIALVGCGDDDDQSPDGPGSSPQPSGTSVPGDSEFRLPKSYPRGAKVEITGDTFVTTTGQKRGGTFKYNAQYAGGTFDPHQFAPGSLRMVRQVYQSLFEPFRDDIVLLVAAKSIEQIDEVTSVVTLRDNLKFHPLPPVNGRQATAQDVKYSYERVRTDEPLWQSQIPFLDKIDATDSKTLRLVNKAPYSFQFEKSFPILIVAPEAVDGLDLTKQALGTGAWMLDGDWDHTRTNRFSRHPDYMIPGRPFPDKLEYTIITDQAAAIAAFRAGTQDLVNRDLPKTVADDVAKSDGFAQRVPTYTPEILGLKGKNPPLDNPQVRAAISLALNRVDLIKKVAFGEGFVNGPVPWAMRRWALPQSEIDAFYNITNYDANLAKAKQLVAAAGGDNLPEIELTYYSDVAITAAGAPLIAEMLRRAGFKVRENGLGTIQVITEYIRGDKGHLISYRASESEDVLTYLLPYCSPAVAGASGALADAEVDGAVNKLVAEFDSEARGQLAAEAQRVIMSKYGNALPMFDGWTYYVVKNRLKDWRAGGPLSDLRQHDMWLDG